MEAIDQLTLRPGKTFRDCEGLPGHGSGARGLLLARIGGIRPAGAEEGKTTAETITIAEPFAVGIYEITMQQWDLCVEAGDCTTKPAGQRLGERLPAGDHGVLERCTGVCFLAQQKDRAVLSPAERK